MTCYTPTFEAIKSAQAEFDARVNKTSTCWLWQGKPDADGYGFFHFTHDGIYYRIRAHRAAFALAHGYVLDPDTVVRHKICDTPLCCNPDHLAIGTHKDNVQDRVTKGRSAHGEGNGRAKLNEDNIRDIQIRLGRGETITSIAAVYSVDRKTIRNIRDGKNWQHMK